MARCPLFDRNALGVALLTACLVSPAAFAGPKEEKVRYRPFNAQITGTEQVYPNAPEYPNPNGCTLVPSVAGVPYGVANLIGNTVGNGTVNGEPVTVAATDCVAAVPPVLFVFRKGRLVMTRAGGDKLNAEYSGALLPTATPSVYAVEGRYVLNGGTGRYAEASGFGELRGTLTTLPDGRAQAQYQLSGKIALD